MCDRAVQYRVQRLYSYSSFSIDGGGAVCLKPHLPASIPDELYRNERRDPSFGGLCG